jgi:hypothetical protein
MDIIVVINLLDERSKYEENQSASRDADVGGFPVRLRRVF